VGGRGRFVAGLVYRWCTRRNVERSAFVLILVVSLAGTRGNRVGLTRGLMLRLLKFKRCTHLHLLSEKGSALLMGCAYASFRAGSAVMRFVLRPEVSKAQSCPHPE
jgi:hypothetical protein